MGRPVLALTLTHVVDLPIGGERGPNEGGVRESWEKEEYNGEGGNGNGGDEFPPGEHPLEGVANLADLPVPEALSAKVDLSEVCSLCHVLRAYSSFTCLWRGRNSICLATSVLASGGGVIGASIHNALKAMRLCMIVTFLTSCSVYSSMLYFVCDRYDTLYNWLCCRNLLAVAMILISAPNLCVNDKGAFTNVTDTRVRSSIPAPPHGLYLTCRLLVTLQVQGLTNRFGDFLTRCLYSKTWSLREAAILKVLTWPVELAGVVPLWCAYSYSFLSLFQQNDVVTVIRYVNFCLVP